MRAPSRLPRLGRLLLRFFLDATAYEVITGDLEEEIATEILPRRGRRAARRWFWYQALAAIAARWRTPRRTPLDRPRSGDPAMTLLLHELRFGLRMLGKTPAFTVTAVLTLAFGLGATTAIFGVLDTLLLTPLPYADSGRVHFLTGWDLQRDGLRFQLPLADYLDYRQQSRSFEDLAAYRNWSVNLSGEGVPERLQGYRLTPNTFGLLGVEPFLGRAFDHREAKPGRDRQVLLSYGFWQRRFGGDREILGRSILLNDEAYTVLGVMPRRFEFPVFNFKGDLWAPLTYDAEAVRADRGGAGGAVIVARLRRDVEPARARAEVGALAARLAQDHPELNAHLGVRLIPVQEMISQRLRPALLVAFVAVGLLLFMVCVNLAGLLLVRTLGRRREMAVRSALGAGSRRLAGQLLMESALLAALGCGGGLLFAAWGLRALRRLVPEFFTRVLPAVQELGMDGRAVVFCLLAALGSVAVFGVVPALRATRGDLRAFLSEGSRGGGDGRQRLRSALVVSQVAISLAMLLITGLLLRTTGNLLAVEPGFDARGVLSASVGLLGGRYETEATRVAFFEEVERRVEALPGVESAGWVNTLPFSTSGSSRRFRVEGEPVAEADLPRTDYRVASPGYLDSLRIPLRSGRGIESSDLAGGLPVVVVNEAFARRFLPQGSPLGRRIQLQGSEEWRTVVGVVGDVLHWQLDDSPAPEAYVPLAQRPRSTLTLAVRHRPGGEPGQLATLVRREVEAVDPGQPVYGITSLEQLVANSYLQQTVAMAVMAVLGLAALLLAALGLYGLISYTVQQSTQEIGIRLALGACNRDVLRLVLRQGLWLMGLGTALGLAAALAVSHLAGSLLFGVEPTDPLTYLLVTALLVAAGILACGVPAYRATRVDPLTAIRFD